MSAQRDGAAIAKLIETIEPVDTLSEIRRCIHKLRYY